MKKRKKGAISIIQSVPYSTLDELYISRRNLIQIKHGNLTHLASDSRLHFELFGEFHCMIHRIRQVRVDQRPFRSYDTDEYLLL